MSNLILVEPSSKYKEQYIEMIEEWKATGENMVPFVLRFDYTDFDSFISELQKLRDHPMLDEKSVNSSTYWLIDERSQVIGAVNIRHRLNTYLLEIGGHIGYGIRPGERRKGYATELLKQALIKAKGLGITKALITCDKVNTGSAKTIINNGGVLDSECLVNGIEIQRYWIEIIKELETVLLET